MYRLGRHSVLALALGLLTCIPLAAADNSAPFTVNDWKVQVKPAAENTQARTFVSFQLHNAGNSNFAQLVVTLEVRDPVNGAAHSSERKTLPATAAGASQTVQVAVAAAVPQAEYRLQIQYPSDGRTRQAQLTAGTETAAPRFGAAAPNEAPKPDAQSAPTNATLAPGRWRIERIQNSQDAKLTGVVTNNTAAGIRNAAIAISLTRKAAQADQPATTVHTESICLEGELAAGATRNVEKIIANCPIFDGLTVALPETDTVIARSPGLGQPKPDSKGEWEEGMQGGVKVEAGFGTVDVNERGDIVIAGKVRNGFGAPVTLQSIEWEFVTTNGSIKKAATDLRGRLPEHTLSPVNITIPGIGDYTRYSFAINYKH